MARAKAPAPPLQVPQGFVASAVRLPTSSRNRAGHTETWQATAWQMWLAVGELRAVSMWTGNVLSRAKLTPAKRVGRMLEPITDTSDPGWEAMEAFYGGPQGQAEALQQFGVHTTVAGEEYVVYRDADQSWSTLASGKVSQRPGSKRGRGASMLTADFGTEGAPIELGDNDLVIRIWTPNPIDPTRADAPTRACLTTLRQIVAYDQHIHAQITSRLAGAGILFMSNEVEFAAPPDADPDATQAYNFMATIAEAMEAAKGDLESPAAMVPIVAMVPTESLGKNEHMKFWSDLDDAVIEMRDAAIRRLALGMDTPPEVLLGVADATHWNAWLSEESAIKAHIEPRLATFSYGVTEQYLQPALKGVVDDPQDYFVIADTASIRLRPNRSQEAIELYNVGELSGEALRRETGFQPEDAPGPEEFRKWLLKRVSQGAVSPEQTAVALSMLGVDIGGGFEGGQQQPDHLRLDTRPQLVSRDAPSMDEARDRAAQPSQGLAAACDALVYRALERAGHKIRNEHHRTDFTRVPAVDIYRHAPPGDPEVLLAGAWACAPDLLRAWSDDIEGVIDTLDFYLRGLLSTRREHSAVVLAKLLETRPVAVAV